MTYPLVSEPAADGIPVTVTCRVLNIARQPYYRWLQNPVTDAEWDEAHLTNAVFDAHRDDPEFGYRFLADEVRDAGFEVCERTVWKICAANGWWSVFGRKKARKTAKVTTPAHNDLVRRQFHAEVPNQLWLADITEHATAEGKLYLCAVKGVFSNRIVGYSIDSRMKARLAVQAIENAVVRREDVTGCIFHTYRGSQFRSRKVHRALAHHSMVGSMGQGRLGRRQRRHGELLAPPEERPQSPTLGHTRGAAHRHRHLDRADQPPPTSSVRTRPIDPR
jgi:putative transposase